MLVRHKTYQLRVYASSAGHDHFDLVLRNCARLYNAALEEWKAAYRHKGHALSVSRTRYDQMKELTGVRQDDPDFWGALSVQVARGVLVRLDRARQSFFRRVREGESPGFPRFKSSARWRTIEIAEPSAAMVRQCGKGYAVCIKGLPTLRSRKNVELPPSDDLKGFTIVRRGRRLWVNLTYRVESKPLSRSDQSVGLDMGISDRIALSTGESVGRRDKANSRIVRAQKRLSRCRKGSRRWRERRSILSNAQDRERICNRNECHRVTTDLVRRFGLIAIEDLHIKNMSASAKGTVQNPGTKVKQKAGLNRAVLEQSWRILRTQLTYKAAWAGRELIAVDPRHTSQTCSGCGVLDRKARTGKWFNCPQCGMSLDADTNAAINILYKAMARGNKVVQPARAVALDAT